jgi:AcrR family transcriptional regulator
MSGRTKYTKVARAESERRTREALLDAADAVFFESDWQRATLVSVAERAGVSKQTLLRQFGSKEGLVRAAHARGVQTVKAQRLAAPSDDLRGAIANLLDHYEEYGERALKIGQLDDAVLGVDILAGAKALHHEWIDHAFGGWLAAERPATRKRLRAALIVLCDVQTWAILTHDLKLGRAEVEATLLTAVERLLEAQR